tara:strand:+ start:283 stop:606 length:324 start_codon:yes stop_codon:yes gene_type:complete
MERNVRGEAFYLNPHQKTSDKQPDFKGKMMLSHEQLRALIEIHERDTEANKQPHLQIDIAGWKGSQKSDGAPYVFCTTEVYTGVRGQGEGQKRGSYQNRSQQEDDWL